MTAAENLAHQMLMFMHDYSYRERTNQLSETEKAIFSKVLPSMEEAIKDYADTLHKKLKEATA